tara:strand:- start:24 stop:788 length:765 start_codon:yes stop_codon:yes gene_type:complete
MKILKLGQMLGGSNAPSAAEFTNAYSLDFDGVDDYVAVGNNSALTITDDITISAWINISSFVDNASILEYALPSNETEAGNFLYRITLENSGGIGNDIKLGHEYGSGSNQFGTIDVDLSTGIWYHLAAVRDISENSWTLYVNGVAKTPYTYTNQATGGDLSELQIARAGTTVSYNGNIDEISIFNSVKSTADIVSIYNSGTPTDLSGESNLVGYWRNGDTAGASVYPTIEDYSSNSNDGTMTNMDSGDIVTVVP